MAKRTPKIQPSFSFRVYPEKDRYFYFICKIFNTRREMSQYYEAHHLDHVAMGSEYARDFQAITIRWFEYKTAKAKKPERHIGEILFHRRQTGSGTVAHEMTHAAIHLAEHYKLDVFNVLDQEEKLAYFVQRMTGCFFRAY